MQWQKALNAWLHDEHGLAWFPRSLVARELQSGSLVQSWFEISLEIRLCRAAHRTRRVAEDVWEIASTLVARRHANPNKAH